jgi:hypothetical protein
MQEIDIMGIAFLVALVGFSAFFYQRGIQGGRKITPLGDAVVHYSECLPYEIIWNGQRFTHDGPA